MDASSIDRCAVVCQQKVIAALENENRMQEEVDEDSGEKYIRTNRIWLFPDRSKWQRRMLTSGIGSRSRSAGAFLRIGRRMADTSPSLGHSDAGPASVDRRGWKGRTAGKYLRIGRAGESADQEMMASGTANDGRPEENPINLLHLRKVNRDVAVDNDALQQQP